MADPEPVPFAELAATPISASLTLSKARPDTGCAGDKGGGPPRTPARNEDVSDGHRRRSAVPSCARCCDSFNFRGSGAASAGARGFDGRCLHRGACHGDHTRGRRPCERMRCTKRSVRSAVMGGGRATPTEGGEVVLQQGNGLSRSRPSDCCVSQPELTPPPVTRLQSSGAADRRF